MYRAEAGSIDRKNRIGDIEMDLIIGKGHNGALLTVNHSAIGILGIWAK